MVGKIRVSSEKLDFCTFDLTCCIHARLVFDRFFYNYYFIQKYIRFFKATIIERKSITHSNRIRPSEEKY